MDKSEKMELERKKDQRGEKKNDLSKRETRGVGGHSCRKGSRVERYTNVMAPAATLSIFFDVTAEALPRENTDVIVILPLDFS